MSRGDKKVDLGDFYLSGWRGGRQLHCRRRVVVYYDLSTVFLVNWTVEDID